MFNLFKELVSPGSVVGLDIHESYLGAVQVQHTLKGPEIERIAFREISDSGKIVEEVQALFREENLRHERIVTCLPASKAIIRHVSLSFDNIRKLEKIIKYQMEPFVPYRIEDTVVDFLPPGSDGDVLTVAVQKAFLSEHLNYLSRANLESSAVSLDDLALYDLFNRIHEGSQEHPVAIVHLSFEKTAVQMIHRGLIDFIRVLPDGKSDFEQLVESFDLYRLKRPDLVPAEILLTGPGARSLELAESLSERTDVKTTLWRPFDQIKHPLSELNDELQAKLSVPLGLALGVANAGMKRFDLRKEEFRIRTATGLKQMLIYMLCSLILLLGLFTFNVYHRIHVQQHRYDALNEGIRELLVQTFPETKHVARGQEPAQMSQKIEEQISKTRWLEDFAQDDTVLDLLMTLTKTISGFSDVSLDNLNIEGTEIRVNGRSPSFETVDRLKEKLAGSGLFREVKLVGAKMDKEEKIVKFNFAMESQR
jgi:Tfp pilus assembly PilM family ATPase/Tfp pilus assembly protein PilN